MGAVTTLTRDIYGNITALAQSGSYNGFNVSVSRQFWYDARLRLCRHRAPELGDELFSYDALDRLQYSARGLSAGSGCATPPAAERTGLVYDALDRVTLTDYPAGTDDLGTLYDSNGNVLQRTRGPIIWDYAYNELDLATLEKLRIDGRTYQFDYGYNASGFLTTRASPSGATFSFTPDGLGRPTGVAVGTTNYISSATYHPNGLVSGANFLNGQALTQSLTARQQPYEIKTEKTGGALVMDFLHSYDARGKVSFINDVGQTGFTRSFEYDANGRLQSSGGPWGTWTYLYDPLGNLRQRAKASRTVDISYDMAKHRVAAVTDSAEGGGARVYTYDTRGNVTDDGIRGIVYDRANQPTYIGGAVTDTSYVYDGNLRRVKSVGGGKTVYTVYSKLTGGLIYRDEVEALKKTDYAGVGPAGLRLVNNRTPTYTHADHLGTPYAETDAAASVLWRQERDPFGESRNTPAGNFNNTGFTGHLSDDGVKLVYMQARYYDPVIGRFLSTDPIGYQDQLNLYAYVHNDPVNMTDPTGQSAVTKFIKQTIKHRGNVIEAAVDVGSEVVTVFAPSSTPLDRIIAAVELVSPVALSDIKDAKKGIEAAGKALGGRKGGAATRAQNQAIGDRVEANGGQVTGGLGRGSESHFPNPDGGTKGGRFSDGSAVDANGKSVQVQTVDTNANGSLTARESAAAQNIANRSGDPVVCVSKVNC